MRHVRLVGIVSSILLMGGLSAASAAVLTEVPPLAGDNESEVRALTPDGKYAAGISRCAGACTPAATRGFFWSSFTLGTYRVGNTGSSHTASTGIGYRTVSTGRQIVVGGNDTSGWVSCFGIPDPGVNPPPNDWLWRARDANTTAQGNGPRVPVANGVGGTSGEFWYFIHDRDNGSTTPVNISIARGQGDPNGTMTGTYGLKSNPVESHVRGVSSTGRAAATRRDGTTPAPLNWRNVYYQYIGATTPTQVLFKGLKAGSQDGQAWAISDDGNYLAGMAPVDGREGNWPYRYHVASDTIVELPTYPDTGGSVNNAIVYGLSADGGFACGMNYRGVERAVLWDVRDASPANWKVYDLTAYFSALGQLGQFTSSLRRAYSVAVDSEAGDVVISGWGVTTELLVRGFVARIPLSAFPLPDTGACCAIGSCSSKFTADCPAIAGQQQFTLDRICSTVDCPGACCDPMNGSCADFVELATCTAGGGTFRGEASACATSSCLGSCCKTDGTCGQEPPGACTAAGGVAGAMGTVCEANTCLGACCQSLKGCTEMNYGACPAADFKGIGTVCAQQTCPCSSSTHVWADHDVDGDVDMDDFGAFQVCFSGMTPYADPACACFDRSSLSPGVTDGAVNESDFLEFEKCATGANVPWSAAVTPNCAP